MSVSISKLSHILQDNSKLLNFIREILISLANWQDITQHQGTNTSTSRCLRANHETMELRRKKKKKAEFQKQ